MLAKNGDISTELVPYQLHPWLRNPHAQTILGSYWCGQRIPYQAKQHFVLFEDGDQTVMHDDRPSDWQPGDRVVLLIHGLGGCHHSGYVVRIAHKLNQLGMRTFRVDLRGCGAGETLAKRPFHAGCSNDIAEAVRMIHALCPGSPLTLSGYSMGGNIVLKLAGEMGDGQLGGIDSVIAVAPPVDLSYCCNNMRNGVNRLYDWDFSRRLVRMVQKRCASDPEMFGGFQFEQRPDRLIAFDAAFTAPQCGFESAQDYYEKASAGPLLQDIKIPGMILVADDDSVVPYEIFSHHPRSSSLQLEVTRGGGHLGFITSREIVPDRRWMDYRVVRWISELGHRSGLRRPSLAQPPGAVSHRAETSLGAFSG